MWFAHIDPCVSGCVGGLVLLLCNGRAGELWAVLWTSLGPLYVRPRAQPARQPVTLDIKTTFRTHIQAFGPKSQWKQNSEILDDDQKPNFHGDHKGAKDCHPIYHLSRLINITEEDCGWVFRKINHKHSQKEDVKKENHWRKLRGSQKWDSETQVEELTEIRGGEKDTFLMVVWKKEASEPNIWTKREWNITQWHFHQLPTTNMNKQDFTSNKKKIYKMLAHIMMRAW